MHFCFKGFGDPDIEGCPQDITVDLGPGPVKRVSWSEPVGTDSQGSIIVPVRTHFSGSAFTVGETIVEYLYTDVNGNVAICTFTVTVEGKSKSSVTSYRYTDCIRKNYTIRLFERLQNK